MGPAQAFVTGQDEPFALVRKNCKVNYLLIYGRIINAILCNLQQNSFKGLTPYKGLLFNVNIGV